MSDNPKINDNMIDERARNINIFTHPKMGLILYLKINEYLPEINTEKINTEINNLKQSSNAKILKGFLINVKNSELLHKVTSGSDIKMLADNIYNIYFDKKEYDYSIISLLFPRNISEFLLDRYKSAFQMYEKLIKLLKENSISTGTLMRSTKTTLYNSFITSHEGQDQYQLMFNYLESFSDLENKLMIGVKNALHSVKEELAREELAREELAREELVKQMSAGKKSKKLPKKEILGKMRSIYKIPGDRKEYLKHNGKLITVEEYKKIMKAKPKKVKKTKSKK
jgi:hypothetical protein